MFSHTLKHHLYKQLHLLSEHCICMDPGLRLYQNSYHWFNFSEDCTICHLSASSFMKPSLFNFFNFKINFSLKLDSHFAAWKIIYSQTCLDIWTYPNWNQDTTWYASYSSATGGTVHSINGNIWATQNEPYWTDGVTQYVWSPVQCSGILIYISIFWQFKQDQFLWLFFNTHLLPQNRHLLFSHLILQSHHLFLLMRRNKKYAFSISHA